MNFGMDKDCVRVGYTKVIRNYSASQHRLNDVFCREMVSAPPHLFMVQ